MEKEFDLNEQKRVAENFCRDEIFSYIVTKDGFRYNGIILEVFENYFLFQDRIIDHPFPVEFSFLKHPIVPSKQKREKNGF